MSMTKLGSVLTFTNGKTYNASNWKKSGYPIIRIQNLNDIDAEYNYFQGELDGHVVIDSGDLLFSWSGSIGTSFGPHIWKREVGVLNQHIFKIGFNSKLVDKKYLFYALLELTKEIERSAHGGVGLVHVKKSDLVNFEIPLPSLETQKQIATVLEKADNLLKQCQQVEQELNALAQSVFLEMFGEPVTNPKRLDSRSIPHCFDIKTGKLNSNAACDDGKYLFFTCSRENFWINEYAFDQKAIILAGNNASADYSVKYYNGKFNAYQRTYIFGLVDESWSYQYFKFALEFQLKNLKRVSKGTNTKYLTMDIFDRTFLLIPSSDEQYEFECVMNVINRVLDLNRKENEHSDNLFESLLQKAFTGKLDLKSTQMTENPEAYQHHV